MTETEPRWVYRVERADGWQMSYGTRPARGAMVAGPLAGRLPLAEVAARDTRIGHSHDGPLTVWTWREREDGTEHYRAPVPEGAQRWEFAPGEPAMCPAPVPPGEELAADWVVGLPSPACPAYSLRGKCPQHGEPVEADAEADAHLSLTRPNMVAAARMLGRLAQVEERADADALLWRWWPFTYEAMCGGEADVPAALVADVLFLLRDAAPGAPVVDALEEAGEEA